MSPFHRFILVLMLSLWLVPDGLAQVATSQAESTRARVAINSMVTWREGASRRMMGNTVSLAPGESKSVRLWAADTLCEWRTRGVEVQTPGSPRFETMSTDGYLWTFDIRLVSAMTDAVVFELDWRRNRRDADGVTQVITGDERQITLTEDDRHVLDHVAATPGVCRPSGPSDIVSMTIEVEASPVDDRDLANEPIAYEVWAVHEDASGARMTSSAATVAHHGKLASVDFVPFPWPITGTTCEVTLTIGADLRGRVQPDGLIDLSVATRTSLALEGGRPASDPRLLAHTFALRRGMMISAGGRKHVTVTPGEAIETVLPNGPGSVIAACEPTAAATGPGVTVEDDHVVIDREAFFAGHRTSLIITATRF